MKKSNILAVLLIATGLCMGSASAHESSEGGAVGGQGSEFAGTVTGNTSVVSSGNSTTAAAGSGNFYSNQVAGGNTIGTATVSGSTSINGNTVIGETTQSSYSYANGSIGGNAVATNAAGQIVNGGTAYDTTSQAAVANGAFQAVTIGAELAFGAEGQDSH